MILLGILTVSCQKDESSAVVEEQENVNNNVNNPETDKDSVVITQGNVVEHAFTRADAAPLVVSLTEQEESMLESGYSFAINLFEKELAQAGSENVCISPLSVQILLGMLTNGLNDVTAARMMEIMFGQDATVDAMNSGYGKLSESLESTNCVKLSNALWLQEGERLNDHFLAIGRDVYHSTVKNLDFGVPQSAMDTICQWAYDNSYGRLKDLGLENLGSNTVMVLGNLVWFASAWQSPFDTKLTSAGTFTLADGTVRNVDMMQRKTDTYFRFLDKYNIVSLPFQNNSFRMDFYVPADDYTLDDIISLIDWSAELDESTKIGLRMPKFTIECKVDIRKLLEDCGMSEFFLPGVFDRMTSQDNDAHVDEVKQAVKIKVEEGGVEAVAATVATYVKRSGAFTIDRPFVFAIRDNASGSFLFMGRVNDIN